MVAIQVQSKTIWPGLSAAVSGTATPSQQQKKTNSVEHVAAAEDRAFCSCEGRWLFHLVATRRQRRRLPHGPRPSDQRCPPHCRELGSLRSSEGRWVRRDLQVVEEILPPCRRTSHFHRNCWNRESFSSSDSPVCRRTQSWFVDVVVPVCFRSLAIATRRNLSAENK